MYQLRPLQMKDSQRMLEWMHDSDTMKYLRFDGSSQTLEDVKSFITESILHENIHVHRAIVDSMDQYCGTVSLKNIQNGAAEFAIVLHPDSVGKGAGSKATKDFLYEAFAIFGLKKIYLNVMHTNLSAIHIYEKLGFRFVRSSTEMIRGLYTKLDWYEIKWEDLQNEAISVCADV